jgi:hypothetical protein
MRRFSLWSALLLYGVMQITVSVAQVSRDGRGTPRQTPSSGGTPVTSKTVLLPNPKPAQKILSVLQAEDQGMVRTSYESLGGSSGDSVVLVIVKLRGPARLVLSVPTGLYLSNASTTTQDMVISGLRGRDTGDNMYEPLSLITLNDGEPIRYIVQAYCAEFHKENPGASSSFRR